MTHLNPPSLIVKSDPAWLIGTDNKKFEVLLTYVARPANSAMAPGTAYEAATVAAKPTVGHGTKATAGT